MGGELSYWLHPIGLLLLLLLLPPEAGAHIVWQSVHHWSMPNAVAAGTCRPRITVHHRLLLLLLLLRLLLLREVMRVHNASRSSSRSYSAGIRVRGRRVPMRPAVLV